MPHIIRLRGPWEFEPLARFVTVLSGQIVESTEDLPPHGATELSSTWSDIVGADFRGIVRLTRRFHCPTGLTNESKVWLVVNLDCASAVILLNDREIGSDKRARFDITKQLQPQNVVHIKLKELGDANSKNAVSIGEVHLEIE